MDKIICVGKNYLEHARELGDAVPEKPVLFLKPPSALLEARDGATTEAPLPKDRGAVHHECEIVLKLGPQGRIEAVTLGLDLTLRDLQSSLKKAGHPWEIAKVFRASAIIGPWLTGFAGYMNEPFSFAVNGETRQQARGSEMRLKPEECIAHARDYFPLLEGDLVFTGTPAGVGPLRSGDRAELRWGDRLRTELRFI